MPIRAPALTGLALALALPAFAQDAAPAAQPDPRLLPPTAEGAAPPPVDRAPLSAPGPGAVGLLPPSVTGFDAALWARSEPDRLSRLIAETDPAVPALTDLMRTLMLAEALPPGSGAPGSNGLAHLLARLDWLTASGAVDEALALLEIVGFTDPALFSRWADLTLLMGRIEAPCRTLAARPALSDDLGLRIFCIARAGEWRRAALILDSARLLGALPDRRVDLLERFLDPELAEDRPPLQPPARPTPLEFRLFEAIGEPLPTAPLPLPFAVLDLDGHAGWRAEIVAAERLARAGALPANRLLGVYTRQAPAASGGVWDRVAAFQAVEDALRSGRAARIGPALEAAWPQMASAGLLVPFSTLFADRLAPADLHGRAARLAERAAFLAGRPAPADGDTDPEAAFLRALARGADLPPPPGALPHAPAVAAAFGGAAPPDAAASVLGDGRTGEALLIALDAFARGAQGDEGALTDALAILREAGRERTARRAATEIMLLSADRALR